MRKWLTALIVLVIVLAGCSSNLMRGDPLDTKSEVKPVVIDEDAKIETATLAGGCFWCIESALEPVDGVIEAVSGFAGGEKDNPTYSDVVSGKTQHVETVQIKYDANKINYKTILEHFWRQIDPTDDGGQFVDRGYQYTTAIFYHNEEQKKIAEESLKEQEESGRYDKPIVTRILPFTKFFEAEDYHQDYYIKSSLKYKFYRYNSGRDQYLEKTWGDDLKIIPLEEVEEEEEESEYANYVKPSDEEIKDQLTSIQYKVTQKEGTERAYTSDTWDNKEDGIYVDLLSKEPLYSSKDKFDSGTGWPSFTKPLEPDNIVELEDNRFFMKRTEIRSKYGDNHLGHVFLDGPPPTNIRHCMNGAALEFIPVKDFEKKGYEKYLKDFENS